MEFSVFCVTNNGFTIFYSSSAHSELSTWLAQVVAGPRHARVQCETIKLLQPLHSQPSAQCSPPTSEDKPINA